MDRVEDQVTLPNGARALNYSKRFYTYGRNGEILGMLVGGPFRKPTSERKWVKDYTKFPMISDGGCDVVTIRFDPKSSKSETWCNGVA